MHYNTTKGIVEIWSLLYFNGPNHKQLLKVVSFMVPDTTTPALRLQELKRSLKYKIPAPDEMREATGFEVSEYFRSHPWLLKKSGTDTRMPEPKK